MLIFSSVKFYNGKKHIWNVQTKNVEPRTKREKNPLHFEYASILCKPCAREIEKERNEKVRRRLV